MEKGLNTINVRLKSAWVIPISIRRDRSVNGRRGHEKLHLGLPEALSIMIGSASQNQHKGKQNHPNDHKDFDTRKPELELSEETNAKVIDAYDRNQEDCDEDARVHCITIYPVLNNEGRGCELVGSYDNIFEPVSDHTSLAMSRRGSASYVNLRVTQGKTKRRINESNGISSKSTCNRKPCSHFAQRTHHEVDEEADEGIGN